MLMSDQWFYIRMWEKQRREQQEMEKNLTSSIDESLDKEDEKKEEILSIEEIKKKYEASQDSIEWIYIFNKYYGEKK